MAVTISDIANMTGFEAVEFSRALIAKHGLTEEALQRAHAKLCGQSFYFPGDDSGRRR
jgi:hypothetical protein